jgi:HK97 family phage portal protein
MANKFFTLFNRENTEVKALKNKLEAALGEMSDLSLYDAKFYDAEPSTFNGSGMYQIAGIDQTINTEQLQRLYATEAWPYIAINAIAKTIAGLPVKLQKRTTVTRQILNSVTGDKVSVQQDNWVDSSGSKLGDRFNYPNKFTTHAEFFMLLVIDLLSAGQYYIYLDSDEDLTAITSSDDLANDDPGSPFGRLRQAMALGNETPVKGMYRIPPSLMKPVPSENGLSIEGYALQAAAGAYAYAPAEIIHVKLPNPTAPLEGLSPLIPAMKPLLLDRFSTEHMIRFYKSGARLGGVIQMSKDMNKEQLGRFQRSFESNYTGRQNHHRTLILPPGMDYKAIEQNPAETALLEFCKFNRDVILAAFNVPPIKAGVMENANYANALVQLKQFFTDTIQPILTFLEDGFNLKNTLMPDARTFRFKFDLSQVEALKDNFKEKAEAAKFMMDGGMTVNEVRDQVWQLGPIDDGDKCKVVEDIKSGKTQASGGMFGLAAPQSGVEEKEVGAQSPEQGLLVGMPGPMVTQIMNIVGRVTRGRLTPEAAVEMMHTIHGVPKANAYRLVGLKPPIPEPTMDENLMPAKDAVSPAPQPDQPLIDSSIVPTGCSLEERVAQLTELFMHRDKLTMAQAITRAIQQAQTEGHTPEASGPTEDGEEAKDGGAEWTATGMAHDPGHPEAPKDKCEKCEKSPCECPPGKGSDKPTLEQYLSDALGKLDPNEPVDPKFIDELKDLYAQTYGEAVTNKEGEIESRQRYGFGVTKDQAVEHWKGFITKTDPIITKRHTEIISFFKRVKSLVMNKLGANLKSYGMYTTRTKSDSEEILTGPEYAKLLKEYEIDVSKIDAALDEAMKYGFSDTLATFVVDLPNTDAAELLKKYAADRIKGIMDTTRDQISDVLNDGFQANKPIAEISADISAKFEEIEQGRAQTIARTETLTAVSLGREQKRQEWAKEFPEQKLVKGWVSAEDDKVRDSHSDLDGTFIDIDETFDNGCRFPRDPDGDAGEVINCRCTDITVVAEDQQQVEDSLNENNSDESDTSAPESDSDDQE